MDDVVISVENLGKKYSIRHQAERYTALRDVLADKAKNLFRRNGRRHLISDRGPLTSESSRGTREDFWALRDVSFEVRRGEVLGIIGRNGAGKTTLLKILSRITDPTEGRVRIKGRVASLLEVGTGLHPELTGRENIYLNGAILGMSRAEIKKKFDEIVAFAETEKFLDTPVKRYSSGMYVRLAFAVAAHLEPEILVVDEVLAVGDAEFQKKCLGKMQDVATREGRTVLFVSHNMGAVNDLCSRCLLIDRGIVLREGRPDIVTRIYLTQRGSKSSRVTFVPNSKPVRFDALGVCDEEGEPHNAFDVRKPICVCMRLTLKEPTPGLHVSIAVFNDRGDKIFYHSHAYTQAALRVEEPGTHEITATIPGNLLVPGSYSINAALHRPNVELYDFHEHVLGFEVEDTGSGRYDFAHRDLGCVLVDIKWQQSS
jgi:lipopolysaccharide transport system ATP-binding protein